MTSNRNCFLITHMKEYLVNTEQWTYLILENNDSVKKQNQKKHEAVQIIKKAYNIQKGWSVKEQGPKVKNPFIILPRQFTRVSEQFQI